MPLQATPRAPEGYRSGNGATPPAIASAARRQGVHVTEMQRRRLLAAFVEVSAASGPEQGGVGQICKRAGVSRRTFYDIFEDREACFLGALEATLERLSMQVLPAWRSGGNWQDRVCRALTLLLGLLDADAGTARMWIVETLRAGPAVLERRASLLAALVAVVDEGRAEAKSADPPPLTAQGVVGGALSVVHAHLLGESDRPLVELTPQLMAMIVHPYLGAKAAQRELDRPSAAQADTTRRGAEDPFKDLPIRFTYRTARVLGVVAAHPGASNRRIADGSGIADEGQMSRLLRRLHDCGLIENRGDGQPHGEPNAWALTERGAAIQLALGVQ